MAASKRPNIAIINKNVTVGNAADSSAAACADLTIGSTE